MNNNNAVTSLWLDNTGLTDWPRISFMMIINTLDLSYNNFVELFEPPSFLRVNNLYLNNNHITDISVLPLLESNLIKTANGYEEIDITGFCINLDLSNNDISDIAPLLQLKKTMKLTLKNNSVSLDMETLDQLTWMEVITE